MRFLLLFSCFAFPFLVYAQNDSIAPRSLLEFMGTDSLHHYNTQEILLADHFGAVRFDLQGIVRFNRVMLSGEGDLRLQLGLPAALTKILLEDLSVFGASPEGHKSSIHFSEVAVDWKADEWGLKGSGDWTLVSIAGFHVDRKMEVQLLYTIDQNRGDRFQLSFKTAKNWYYFDYSTGTLLCFSSNDPFIKQLQKLPKKQKQYKLADRVKHIVRIGNSVMYQDFLKQFKS
jgi:hypothetical protein